MVAVCALMYQGVSPMAPISQLILVHWIAVHESESIRPPVSPLLAFQDQKLIPCSTCAGLSCTKLGASKTCMGQVGCASCSACVAVAHALVLQQAAGHKPWTACSWDLRPA